MAINYSLIEKKSFIDWNDLVWLLFGCEDKIHGGKYDTSENWKIRQVQDNFRKWFYEALEERQLPNYTKSGRNHTEYFKGKKEDVFSWIQQNGVFDWLRENGIEPPKQTITLVECVESEPVKEIHDSETKPTEEDAAKYSFICDGDVWKVTFKEESLPSIKNIDGMKYIHELISGPQEGISCQDLYNPKISSDNNPFTEKPDSNDDPGMSAKEESMDQEGINSIRNQKEEAEKELEGLLLSGGTNSDEARELEGRIEKLNKYLSGATDKRGKPKSTLPNNQKNIQNNVCNSITRAIKVIQSYNSEAGAHFESAIDKGFICLYKGRSIKWNL